MIAPATRAAVMAMLSIGCSAWDMGAGLSGEAAREAKAGPRAGALQNERARF
jgi:hypothetical protein